MHAAAPCPVAVKRQPLRAVLEQRGDQGVLGGKVPVEGVVGQAGGGHDVGHPRPGGHPALPHDLQGRVEQAADLARVAGLPLGQGPLRDPFRNIILGIKN